jgi:hypothetical protein
VISSSNVATSWAHPDILLVFDEILATVPETDGLYETMVDEIQCRLLVLLSQEDNVFELWLKTHTDLEAALGRWALKSISSGDVYRSQDQAAGMRYCSNSDENAGVYCRLQVFTGFRTIGRICPGCSQSKYLSPHKPPERLWRRDDPIRAAKRAKISHTTSNDA